MDHIIDHTGFNVSDFARSVAFYKAALAPLGITMLAEYGPVAGFGRTKPELWLAGAKPDFQTEEQAKTIVPVHLALAARSRAEVDAFYAAAIAAGARDNGPPGIRAHYHPNYYGAFVLDPDGHNIEAVVHQ